MNYLLDTLTDGAFSPLADFFNTERNYSSSSIMKTDIKETEKEYLLDVELPGFNKKDLSLSYEDGYLTITAKVNRDAEDKKHTFLRRERYMGTYQRSFYIGEDVEKDNIVAKYNDGILEISVPKEDKKIVEEKHTIAIN